MFIALQVAPLPHFIFDNAEQLLLSNVNTEFPGFHVSSRLLHGYSLHRLTSFFSRNIGHLDSRAGPAADNGALFPGGRSHAGLWYVRKPITCTPSGQ